MTCIDVNECEVDDNGGCTHECENFEGSYRCKCPVGFRLEEDRSSCVDVDECREHNGGCSHTCVNLLGDFECHCPPGHHLRPDNKTCDTMDPCAHDNGGCDQLCSFETGKAVCSCKPGYERHHAQNKCVDIDECAVSAHKCQQTCVNTEGSYKCECQKGYRANAHGHCLDVDECEHFNGGCSQASKCMNTAGSFRCVCPSNFKLGKDKKTCLEIQDKCKPLKAPRYGQVRCTRSRHKTQLYYRTKCDVWCDKGFKLNGPATNFCNGTGEWSDEEAVCVRKYCHRLGQYLPMRRRSKLVGF
jgi:Calcium-binding EGF domain/Coagulation Factor Xa inhibitory site/Complement Clr-like EGF-like/Sushi repeat (SCR repeat)